MSKAVSAYVERCKEIMGLSHWEVKVSDLQPDDDAWAEIEVSENLYQATIRFSKDLWKEKPEEIRRVVAHELIHIHQAGVERMVDALEKPLGSSAYEVVLHVWDVESERCADSLSTVVAKVLPMPGSGVK
jgi:hypothetical protein